MKAALGIVLICFTINVEAQTWQEWTQQKKTQIKYLISQIAALHFYTGYVKKGYTIAKKGISAIDSFKEGDFSLHSENVTALKRVNPNIRNYWKVADIVTLGAQLVKSCHLLRSQLRRSGQFTQGETIFCNKVLTNLLDGCTGVIKQLILLTTTRVLEMKDDERIKRIDALLEDIKDKYSFVQHFSRKANELQINRIVEGRDVRTSSSLSNINQ